MHCPRNPITTAMKSYHLFLAAAAAAALSSCVEPVVVRDGPPSRYRAPYVAPGHAHPYHADRYAAEHRDWRDPRNPRSPYSPGGSVVLPGEARRVSYHGQTYYRHHNTWYRPSGRGYVIVAAPY